jgi:hypothetical protein
LKERVLFIVNSIYFDNTRNEGGVRNCTLEYINLLSTQFEVILFPVSYSKSIFYKIRSKLGLNIYNDYTPTNYKRELQEAIIQNSVHFVFLNLSNTMTFASVIKEEFNDVKVILCSHGNESGDHLHHSFRFKQKHSWLQRFINSILFAKMIEKEVDFRLRFLDLVLTVSEVEEAIEKWLGAKKVFMVPRVLKNQPIPWDPHYGRVGFLGDLSHKPNYEGIVSFCDAIVKSGCQDLKFRLLGSPIDIGNELAHKYPFLEYCGFVPEDKINEEVATWSLFLNLVFYYSRGVSTKLAKGLGWGIPVLSTTYGNRGYNLPPTMLKSVETPSEMVEMAVRLISDRNELNQMRKTSIHLSSHFSDFKPIMDNLYPLLMA